MTCVLTCALTCILTCALTCALRQVGRICVANIDAKCGNGVYVKLGRRVTIIFQHLLHTSNASVEFIDILHHSHSFCHKGITVVIDGWKILRPGLSIQTSGIHHLNVVIKLIQSNWHISLIIPVHTCVHQQFANCSLRVIPNSSFAEERFRYGTLGYDAIADK